jgi:acetyl esterase/lipase
MPARFQTFTLQGPLGTRVNSLVAFAAAVARVLLRRLVRGPLRPSWSLDFEIATQFFKMQDAAACRLAARDDVAGIRRLIDALVFRLPALEEVRITPQRQPLGAWFETGRDGPTLLYFHGGGYTFYPAMTDNIIAAVASSCGGRTFVPWYRLAPDHLFPSPLEDGLAAYDSLLAAGTAPHEIVVAGDSAGGHLALALLLALAEHGRPLPAAGILISPWTDPCNGGASIESNRAYDWMSPEMSGHLARWAGAALTRCTPARWPDRSALAALPPLLVHAGEAEICRDMITTFCAHAQAAGAAVTLRLFADMNHNFHGFGALVPQSREALAELGAFARAAISPARPALRHGTGADPLPPATTVRNAAAPP